MKLVWVEFKEKEKQYLFNCNNFDINPGDYLIVETKRGLQLGKAINIVENDKKEHSNVLKKATNKDVIHHKENLKEAKEAIKVAQDIADEMNLEMKFIDAYYTFDRKQLIFSFLADSRIDFRELAKSLAGIYKTRIELRQIGVRDKAKEVSGIGCCGRKICCSSFLNDLDSVSISMVKNQNLSLNPTKINGLCGRLLCCLKFEDELYTEYRKKIPSIGEKVKEKDGFEGTVTSIDILNKKYIVVNNNNEFREYFIKDRCDKCEKTGKNK